jgi:hypothetical protein
MQTFKNRFRKPLNLTVENKVTWHKIAMMIYLYVDPDDSKSLGKQLTQLFSLQTHHTS